MTTPWYPYEKYGSYYRLIDDELHIAPMLINGDPELQAAGPVEFENISQSEDADCQQITKELQGKLNH
jgi:hypothetical protein